MGDPGRVRDLDELTSWNADWTGLRVLVLGLGSTGFSVADTLIELGATVLVAAADATDERKQLLDVIGGEFVAADRGDVFADAADRYDPELVIVSPGFAPSHPAIGWAQARGVAIWGDIELAWRVRDKVMPPAEWLMIAGAAGKSTTAHLTVLQLEAADKRVASVGDGSIPALDAIRYPAGFDVLVVELSSRQLHWLGSSAAGTPVPWSSVCLNGTDAGDDATSGSAWHGSVQEYRAALGKVYANTRVGAIYNRADSSTIRMVELAEVTDGARAIGVGLDAPGPSDFGIVDGILCDRAFLEERRTTALELSTRDELAEVGLGSAHHVADVLFSAALVRSLDVLPATVRSALLGYTAENGV